MILGIDEVGRGPWAGPLVVGAVVLGDRVLDGLTDSKKLTPKRRRELATQIYDHAAAWGLGWVHADELDAVGLSEGLARATRRAVESIKVPYTEIIIDGTVNFLKNTAKGNYVTTMAKADLLIPSVSAASIIAKVARDEYMAEQDLVYPGYEFARHAGYGTAFHAAALREHGVSALHRRSFAPIAALLGEGARVHTPERTSGAVAEDAVQSYLEKNGYVIVARNWRTKWCEIDIVAERDGILFFVEVKYRRSSTHGGGVEALTSDKRRRMRFAAELFMASRGREVSARLVGAAVSGNGELEWFECDEGGPDGVAVAL